MIVRPLREVADLRRRGSLRHDAHQVVGNLEESALDLKPACGGTAADPELTTAEQRYHRCVPGEDADLTIERRRDDRLGVALEEHRFR
jgi:hypothetical protein